MRQHISDVATALFIRRGFDAVTVDEIARAADVGRMTVFNHFPRKEDLFFDREGEIERLAARALRGLDADTSPLDALRRLVHRLVLRRHPAMPELPAMARFVEAAAASEALTARARQLRDAFVPALAAMLAEAGAGAARTGEGDTEDARWRAHLVAALLTAGWSAALQEARLCYSRTGDETETRRCFVRVADAGMEAAATVMEGAGRDRAE